jgi:predicted RNA-binding protein YlxR (DUF448 family)
MKQRKVPMRRCVVTREQFPKNELIRVVRDKEGTVTVDTTGRANGRGAYLKLDSTVIKNAKKRNVLSRVLEVEVDASIYDELEALASEKSE